LGFTKTDTPAQPPAGTPKKTEKEQLPPGVVARLGVPRLPLRSPMAFAPDGRTFVGVSGDSVIRFDAATGKVVGQTKFSESFSRPQLSSDGQMLADFKIELSIPGPRMTARVWDTATGKMLFERTLQDKFLISGNFSSKGKWLAGIVYLPSEKPPTRLASWDLTDRKERLFEPSPTNGTELVFSPDGRRLLTWNGLRGIECWDVGQNRIEWTSRSRSDKVLFAPDGRLILRLDAIANRWFGMDALTGKSIEGLQFPTELAYSDPAVAPDNRTFILPTKRGVVFWDMKEGRERCLLQGTSRDVVWGASFLGPFSPDGKSILTNFGSLQRYDIATGRPLWPDTTDLGQTAPPAALVYSPDGKWLASGANEDYTVRIWDMRNRRIAHTLRGHASYVRALSFTPDSTNLVTGGGDSTVRIWDVPTGRELRVIRLHDGRNQKEHQQVVGLEVSGDGKSVATFGLQRLGMPNNNGDVYSLYDLSNGKSLERLQNAFGSESDIVHGLLAAGPALLHENGSIVGKNGVPNRPSPKKQEQESLHNSCIAARPFIAAAGVWRRDNPTGFYEILVWEVSTGRPIARLPVKELQQMAFAPSGSSLVTTNQFEIQNWDIRTGKIVRSQPFGQTAARRGTTSLAVSPDGKTAATGHDDGTILLWDIAPPELKPTPLTASERDKFWTDLAGSDAAKAFAAACRFADDPNQSLPFLKERLRAIHRPTVAEVKNLLAELQSPVFKTREAAEKKLRSFADLDESPLREALKADPPAQARKRIEAILASLSPAVAPQGETLRGVRAVWVLERIGTAEARKLLESLAAGDSRLAREAKAALERK
jgi:WD40 repeat protein